VNQGRGVAAGLAVVVAVAVGLSYTDLTDDGGTPHVSDGIPDCMSGELPTTTVQVVDDIEQGGPFDYPGNDGGTFRNDEELLPDKPRGYYREYTVDTPGSPDRGARRIVTGGFDTDDPELWFFTDDHYDSFCELAPDMG